MNKRLLIVCGSLVLATSAFVTGYMLLADRSVDKALAIQRQLTSESPPPQIQRQLVQDLTRMVDKMDRDQLRAVSEQVREESRRVFETNLEEYLSASEGDREAVLDRHLEVSQQWRQVYAALRTDAFRVRGRRQPRGDRNPGRRDDERRAGENRRGNANREAESRNATRNEAQREQYAVYWEALRARAEEQGVDLGRMGRRGGRRGGRNG
ncbi:MAG: hypothetical protein AAGF97_20155 [Planctomycetota bacterium]